MWHEYGHKNLHFITGGDYGWILIHNGEVMRKFINEGQNSVGNVDSRLNAIAGRSRKTGWVGIVMAGMKGAHYSTGFEKEVIKSAANMTKDEFLRLFKLVRLK